ncbi:MAG TPA: hypothetical protein VM734_02955 [Kofleriaceae bacterium]|nr:hypothetical protein [Kofleriaceae bacterium]
MPACGHPLCELVGGDCSLAAGLSRGCQTGPRKLAPVDRDLIDEVAALLTELAPSPPPGDPAAAERQRTAATRLAFLFRREARTGRSLLVLAADDQLDPDLATRLQALCRRRR